MSGGQAAVAALQAENVSHVFGLIGSATMEMFDALYDADDIHYVVFTTNGPARTWPTASLERRAKRV